MGERKLRGDRGPAQSRARIDAANEKALDNAPFEKINASRNSVEASREDNGRRGWSYEVQSALETVHKDEA